MTVKILQLNIEKGKRIDAILKFVHKNKFDILSLQEVTNGKFNPGQRNMFDVLKDKTGFDGIMIPYLGFRGDPSTYYANAILWNEHYHLVVAHAIWLKRYMEVTSLVLDYRKSSRVALAALLTFQGKNLMVISTHLAWGPTPNERVYQRNQAAKLYDWLKTHRQQPFVLTGDFNLNPHTYTVEKLGSLGSNLTTKYKITNTLNPRTHRIPALFPSGLAVDYIITDKRLTIKKFFVEELEDLSDHFGLVVEFSL